MLNLERVDDLKNAGILLYDGMLVAYPTYRNLQGYTAEPLDLMKIHKNIAYFNRKGFNINGGTVVFYNGESPEAEFYAFPSTEEVARILIEDGYRYDNSIYVPFSNGDYPLQEAQQWEALRKHYQGPRLIKERRNACLENSKEHGIRKLPKLMLRDKCLHVPEEGINVYSEFHHSGYIISPVVRSCDCTTEHYLGSYSENNKVVIFVDADGETYLTGSTSNLFKLLREHGFREIKTMVPLSNGETIEEDKYKSKWKRVLHLADLEETALA